MATLIFIMLQLFFGEEADVSWFWIIPIALLDPTPAIWITTK